MTILTSKLTGKYQATIPDAVRKALNLKAGDAIAFEIDNGEIRLRKARPIDLAFAHALEGTLSEWEFSADEEAYSEL
ncbi:AbrB/MazE/SpoVT family DNA-binding domain-containing protein [Pistricoccus aurantiacus]|uniref:AbrB/MazE/SpoVT family DNA-binding domain-containing protein n=1 Tax=Pistricoccus aurantiacus TaxID=1883414 RepID=A0A5B8SSR6_9GAMM|nr:AbrB/MazE/SpoVT family DNA-binding domain-containing protein [Pistricoccus aurantiacus]QEA37708.1 AbrB/MazE/SpoVT family DNA-binding domain-containing protein [Pistricoccus aurantiacus]